MDNTGRTLSPPSVKEIKFTSKPNYSLPHERTERATVLKGEAADLFLLKKKLQEIMDAGSPIVEACARTRKEQPWAAMEPEKVHSLFVKAVEAICGDIGKQMPSLRGLKNS
ncbi:MAG: hypothetical protein LBQ86_04185 [Holophagales bacterium]|jgi:hypothetical protein|nr:hypothetical protein [Holophagales bacterium]